MTKFESLIEDFDNALERYEEVLKQEKSEIVRDSAIKRFEIVFELAWKTAKAYLEKYHNARCTSPQSCFRECFRQGMIEYDDFWIEMAKWRNEAGHIYNEELAESLYKKLPRTLKYLKSLSRKIKKEIA